MRFLCVMMMALVAGQAWAQGSGAPQATPVIVTKLAMQPLVDELEALGTLRANERVELASSVTERVTAVHFEDGQRVRKGDVLVEMDAAEELALMTEEESTLREAERQLKRVQKLAKQGVSSNALLDERKRDAATARARMSAIQSRVNERRITAPFDGVVGLRNVSVGALVQPGMVITTVDDDSVMKLDFPVPSVFMPSLKKGVAVKARARAFPEKDFSGTVSSVDSRIDPVTRSIVVRALVANSDALLKPGLLMRVELQKNPRQALMLPEEALMLRGDKHMAWVVEEKEVGMVANMREVEIGVRTRGDVEVLSGLHEGDMVVTHGGLRLREGSAVSVSATEKDNEPLEQLLQN